MERRGEVIGNGGVVKGRLGRAALPSYSLALRIGGQAHSMVWDPSGERLAVLMKGKRAGAGR